MRYRILYITALLVGGFLLVTSRTNWGQRRIIQPISQASRYLVRPRRRAQRRIEFG